MNNWPWVIEINSPFDPRHGIKVRHIESGNDGDICNSIVTYELLKNKTNPHVIDIGVDEGWWSFFVADLNPSSVIDAFEPNPISFKNLIQYLDDTPQLRLHNFAISNKSGFIPLSLEHGQSNSRCETGSIQVPCTTLDRYIKGRNIDMIKIDTEGHDLYILESLHPYLNNIGAILFEFTVYWCGKDKEECISKACDELKYLKRHYKHMYSLSRRGLPTLNEIFNETISDLVNHWYTGTHQTDILVCNEQFV